jgi:uncharacterized protein DUF4105
LYADERDVIGVRTTHRQPQEDVYIYRTRAPLRNIHRVFLDYIKTISEMREHPRFYNTLTTNCTTTILMHTRINSESPPMSWKVLLSGYVPDYLYELGRSTRQNPFLNWKSFPTSTSGRTRPTKMPPSRNALGKGYRSRHPCRNAENLR